MCLFDDNETGGVSFIWTIQNFSHYIPIYGYDLESPSFVLETASSIKWSLRLYHRPGDQTDSFSVFLVSDGKCTIPFHFALSIRFNCGSFKKYADKISNTREKTFDGFEFSGNDQVETGAFLYNDALTLRCRMWKDEADILKSVRCYAHTKRSVDEIVYVWTLETFFADPYKTKSTKVQSMSTVTPSFRIDLLNGENGGRYEFKVQQIGTKEYNVSTCKISLLDADGNVAYSVKDSHWFDGSGNEFMRIPFLPKEKLLSSEKLYLPYGTLSLLCEFTVSMGVESSRVEKTLYGIEYDEKGCSDEEEDPDESSSLKDCLQRSYYDGKFSDLTIRVNNKEFRAHKVILCGRSEIFSAMFEHDTKENRTGVVEIEDLDDGTVSKMLQFIYTDIFDDLEWESACELYFAADKYEITGLKAKCSDFLKDNVDVSNVCDLLTLADRHQDTELKLITKLFISEHANEIMKSHEWKAFMQVNLPLASETMHLLIVDSFLDIF